jgi:hypothetical protein
LVALTTVALAQPLLDLLGRNAAFLVAHDATGLDVVLLAVGLTLLLPLAVAAVVLVAARVHRGAGIGLHRAVLAVLLAILALVVFRRSGLAVPGVAAVALAVVLGVLGTVVYARSTTMRRLLGWVALAAPAVAVFFVVATPARALVLPAAPGTALELGEDPPPVVVAIFDEFPTASLLRGDGELDADNFPAFARLADEGVFFRNMTTVHQQTSDAIPAALTGRYGDLEALPLAADHPDNLLAMLAGAYELHVLEPITQLCPPGVCANDAPPAGRRYRSLLADLRVVGLHAYLPPDLTGGLPPIDQGWQDFRQAAAAAGKEAAVAERFEDAREADQGPVFDQFLDGIRRTDEPVLHLIHTMLPHSPWRYLPDGRSYTDDGERPGMVRGLWLDDEWRVAHNYQRHLIQTQMVDRLLGDLVDRLEEQGLYDDALIVVMADHGISFTPETSLRVLRPETFGEIGAVPFFVKLPGQKQGAVFDSPLELVDVLPTILDAIGAQPPLDIDGRSALGQAPLRTEKRYYGPGGLLTFPPDGAEKRTTVERRARLFGADGPFAFPYNLAPAGHEGLLGNTVDAPAEGNAGVVATIEDAERYEAVDLTEDASPLLVRGVVTATGDAPVPDVVAISVNGRIGAVVRVDRDPESPGAFRALVPEEVMREGANTVAVLAVATDGRLSSLEDA